MYCPKHAWVMRLNYFCRCSMCNVAYSTWRSSVPLSLLSVVTTASKLLLTPLVSRNVGIPELMALARML